MIESYEGLVVPGPITTHISAPFWAAAREGELALQQCDACAQYFFYPRAFCPHCWSERTTWRRASGEGVIKSFSIIHRPGHFAWTEAAPYVIALIELKEGPTMLSQMAGVGIETVEVGQFVQVSCTQVGQHILPFFRLQTGSIGSTAGSNEA
ncbi:Zn-ribbon domain-containing OB-fold protein [Paraburkholderia agricolaris]|uniref:Zn-ribbon domain-containing OB-fold protein n=1 Tax=Paraburkholderia agricolaris TaxID=2152888 RepID=A0ABW8ZLJ8_9BURK